MCIRDRVVVGYGTQKKGELTSSISSIKSETFIQGSVQDAAQLLQGKVAGLGIVMPNGDPTSSSQIVLRGIGSLKGDRVPLVIVDGVPVSYTHLDVYKRQLDAPTYINTQGTGKSASSTYTITLPKNQEKKLSFVIAGSKDSEEAVSYTHLLALRTSMRKHIHEV